MRSFIAAAALSAVAAAGDLGLGTYSGTGTAAATGTSSAEYDYGYGYSSSSSSAYYAASTSTSCSSSSEYASVTGYASPVYGTPYGYVTETYDTYTTYCSEATTLTYGEKTYVAAGPTTLTITSCTVTKPVYTSMVISCPPSKAPAPYETPCPSNGTASAAAQATGTMPHYPSYSNSAAKLSGMGVAAVVAVAAFL